MTEVFGQETINKINPVTVKGKEIAVSETNWEAIAELSHQDV